MPGVAQPLPNSAADYEKLLVKNDFGWAAKNRDRILAEWAKRYERKKSRSRRRHGDRRLAMSPSSQRARAVPELRHSASLRRRCADDRPASPGRVRLLARALGLRQDHAAAHHRRPRDAERRHASCRTGATSRALPPAQRDYGIVFQSYALFPESHRRRQRRLRAGQPARKPRAEIARASRELLEAGRPARPRAASTRPALRRPAAAHRAGPCAGALSPGLLLLDEPLSALDALERVRLRGEIRALQQRLGVTTIMVTHDQEEALSMADRIVVMNQGAHRAGRHAARHLRDAGDARSSPTSSARSTCSRRYALGGQLSRRRHRTAVRLRQRLRPGRRVRLYLRPEDRAVEGSLEGDAEPRARPIAQGRVPRRTSAIAELTSRRARRPAALPCISRSTSCTTSTSAKAARSSSRCAPTVSASSAA